MRTFIVTHKIISAVVVIALLGAGYLGYRKFTGTTKDVRYITAAAEKGNIVATVSGTGQVSTSNQIDLQAKVSGTITYVGAKAGDTVPKGKILFSIDAGDASKKLRDANLALQTATLALADAERDYTNTKASLDTSLKDKLTALNSAAIAVPDETNKDTNVVSLTGSYISDKQGRYTITTYACSGGVCYKYEGLENGSDSIVPNSGKALGSNGLYITFSVKPQAGETWTIDVPSPQASAYHANLEAYTQAKTDNENTLTAKESAIENERLGITQKENAVSDAREALADYNVVAPFGGTVASISAKVTDMATGTLGTLITNQKIADISMNEVDVAKIKLGQKATLTFDAIPELTIAGEVAEIDSVGTVSQGVVTYNVKINFDTEDARIKPAMSVSAAIITDMKQDILVVPNSAVKTQNGTTYVEGFGAPLPPPADGLPGSISKVAPNKIPVVTGISNDSETEIVSGLEVGDEIVTRTIMPTTTAAKTATPSLFGAPAGGGRVNRGN